MKRHHLLPCLLLAQALTGCNSGSSETRSATPVETISTPPPTPSLAGWHGHFGGIATIGGWTYEVDGFLTVDGAIRLHLPGAEAGPEKPVQLVGAVEIDEDLIFGNGILIGQECAAADPSRFCGPTTAAEITITRDPYEVSGEIRVITNGDAETWSLTSMGLWTFYSSPADLALVEGLYQESRAEFVADGDTVVSVDATGSLFFQSAGSGCVGNGQLAPHLDGAINVYDVSLSIDSCDAPYAHLNGVYEGLATQDPSGPWNYDFALYVWVSTVEDSLPLAAVTMLAPLL